jgi:AraC family transcriptional regulator, regulatory protein of adaptative response / DNA-3-methyladenine glycosylase II
MPIESIDSPQGLNPEEALIERLVAAMCREPAGYRDADDMASAAGVGQARLFELFRMYYHTTPADMLARLRVAAARRALLDSSATLAAIAGDVGFDSLPAFHDTFHDATAMSPADYRQMREAPTFVLALPKEYLAQRTLAHLGRDRGSLTDRVEGATWISTVRLGAERGALVRVAISPGQAQCEVLHPTHLDAAEMERVHGHVISGLGLRCDPLPFETQLAASPELAPLIEGQRGLRIPLIGDYFDGLVWAITGQQITLSFAYTLRRRLIERAGREVAEGMFTSPLPRAVAQLTEEELGRLQYSRAKASYLIGAAQAVVDGRLPLDQLAEKPVTQIERLLLALRGIGPWSAHYLLMRAYGFLDCVPVGDAGLTTSLQRFFKLERRPDKRTTLTLMESFSPYRSLATFHLWQRLNTNVGDLI